MTTQRKATAAKATEKSNKATAADAETTGPGKALKLGLDVYAYRDNPRPEGKPVAVAAKVVNVTDAARGRVDLLLFESNGTTRALADVEYSAEPQAGAWSFAK